MFPAGSGKAAGCIVTEGKLVKGCQIAVIRKKKEVYFGKLDSLRRVKELAKQVRVFLWVKGLSLGFPRGLKGGLNLAALIVRKTGRF